MTLSPRFLALCAFALLACSAPEFGELPPVCDPQLGPCPPPDPTTSTTADEPPTGGIQTVTGPTTTSTTGEASTTGDDPGTTTGEPLLLPAIVDHLLAPNPLTDPGTIQLDVTTEHATGVRMQVDDGDTVELASGPDTFTAELPIYTGLSSGTHHMTLVAWRDDLESEPVVVPFEVALDPPGEGYVWESADLLGGQGSVAALAALPTANDGHVLVEWGTYYPGGQARCYLRRRDTLGAWGPGDVVELHPGVHCVARDLAVTPGGELYLLASRTTNNDARWWLGRIPTWETAATPENLATGGPGDVGHALALGAGKVAVCGTRPVVNPNDKLDAAVWVLGEPVQLFDYDAPDFDTHHFDETLRDCVFDGPTLVGVGDASGVHTKAPNEPKRRKHLQVRLDLDADLATPHVGAEIGLATQSVANAVALDRDGRVVTVGHLCGDTCKQDAYLWVHAQDGKLEWYTALGADFAAPLALAASPAGYLVLGGARKKGPVWSSFWLRAYFLGDYAPVWTYERDDAPVFQYATAVAVGPEGHVYGGGVGANGYPAVAYVTP